MKKTVIINNEFLGGGDNTLGKQLMGSFLRKMCSLPDKPGRILFYNSGVKLLAEGSDVLDALDILYEAGVDLIACGTCVTYFELKDKIALGRVSDMNEILSTVTNSSTVITV